MPLRCRDSEGQWLDDHKTRFHDVMRIVSLDLLRTVRLGSIVVLLRQLMQWHTPHLENVISFPSVVLVKYPIGER